MTGNDPRKTITDARALLDTMLATATATVHVVSGDTEIFISRSKGASPLTAPSLAPVPAALAGVESERKTRVVSAPHVATLVSVGAVGDRLSAGDAVAILRVLDREERLGSEIDGEIVAVYAAPGDLVEYGMPLVTLGVSA